MRVAIRKSTHVLLVLGAIVCIALAAVAAKPTLAARSSGASWITLNPSPLIGGPKLGGTVTFSSYAGGLAGWEWPMVAVSCSQSGTVVYVELEAPSSSFLLGGNSSQWLLNGGAASCTATLYAYGFHAGSESIRTLASTGFSAAGS